jgi:hypothetical protein
MKELENVAVMSARSFSLMENTHAERINDLISRPGDGRIPYAKLKYDYLFKPDFVSIDLYLTFTFVNSTLCLQLLLSALFLWEKEVSFPFLQRVDKAYNARWSKLLIKFGINESGKLLWPHNHFMNIL